jgi:hypothetical protein
VAETTSTLKLEGAAGNIAEGAPVWVLQDQIDPGNVGKIIDAVLNGYTRRKVILPDIDGIDRIRLRRDIDRKINFSHTFSDLSPKQPWRRRSDHADHMIHKIDDLIRLIEGDGEASWWRGRMAPRDHKGQLLPLPVIGTLRDYRDRLSRLQRNGLEVPPATESRQEWLVGALAVIYERDFQIKPTAGRSSRNINRNGVEIHYPVGSPFTAFVMAVYEDAGISPISAPTIADLLSRQRRRSKRNSTQSP